MVSSKWISASILALGLSSGVNAQDYSSALTGVKPSDVQFKKIDTGGLLRTPTSTMGSVGPSRFSSISNFFRKFTGTGTTPIRGGSTIPAPNFNNAYSPRLPTSSVVR